MSDDGFLSRWSRRKAQVRQGVALEEPTSPTDEPAKRPATQAVAAPLPAQSVDAAAPPPAADAAPSPPPPTLADVAALTRDSDFSRFVAPGVEGEVKNAALKKLFGDPRFNVMDGLDIYIDDYNKPDPLPLASIRKMTQAAFLGLVQATPASAPAPDGAAPAEMPGPDAIEAVVEASNVATPEPDENADLRLQSHDATGCGSAEDGAAGHERRQS